MLDPLVLDCPLEVTREWWLNILGDRSSISNVTFNYLQRWSGLIQIQKSILHGLCHSLLLQALLHNFVYTCWWQKTSCAAVVPTPIVFPMKWHLSKLMGCNHHHKYTVTRPTACSWVFNSQSMGCKEWQAWGTQFPISLTTPSENWTRIQKLHPKKHFSEFENLICLRNIFGDCTGETFIGCACDRQSILVTLCLRHPSTLSSCEIILIKVCPLLATDLRQIDTLSN